MSWSPIAKSPAHWKTTPHLTDYAGACDDFSWDSLRREVAGLPEGQGLNIAHAAVDHHAQSPRGDHTAIRWIGKQGQVRTFSYGDLAAATNRFANVLRSLGVGPGERVFSFAGRLPELYIAALGTLKHTSVFCPLFSAFGPEPVLQRLTRGNARVLVTTEKLYRTRIESLRPQLPELRFILPADAPSDLDATVLSLPRLLQDASPEFCIPPTDPEAMALLHFTSGMTSPPSGSSTAWANRSIPKRSSGASALSDCPSTTTGGKPKPAAS